MKLTSCQSIVSAEGLVLVTDVTAHLLLPSGVDRMLVPCKIVGPREDGIACFACRRVDAFALVRASLGVAERGVAADKVAARCCLPVCLALVSLESGGRVEAVVAVVVGASVGARIRRCVGGTGNTLGNRHIHLAWRRAFGRLHCWERRELGTLLQEVTLRAMHLRLGKCELWLGHAGYRILRVCFHRSH